MRIEMTGEMAELIAGQLSSGRYDSAESVVEDALRMLQMQEKHRETFDLEMERRLEALNRGEVISPERARQRVESAIAHAERLRA